VTYPPQQPPYGQQPQQPYGQQPYGQQQYPQQQQPYGYGYPPPKKSKTGLIVGIALGAVVVLGGSATALILFMSDSGSDGPTGDPAATAQQYVDAVNARDGAALRSIACTPMSESDSKFAGSEFAKSGFQLKLAGPSSPPREREAYFWADGTRSTPSGSERAAQRYMVHVRVDGSRWCVGMGATGMPN
jgi:hypothetical protein